MADKKKDGPDVQGESSGTANSKRARSRRLVLKSMVAGGAVTTTAKTLPEKWVRPITDSAMLPAHAQSSPSEAVTLTCGVVSLAFDAPSDEAGDGTFTPDGPPFQGGDSTTVDNFLDAASAGNIDIQFGDIFAEIDPPDAGDITLTLTPGGNYTLDSAAGPFDVTPDATSGVAGFGNAAGDLSPTDSGPSIGNLSMVFSAPGVDDCVIDFTFTETSFSFV